MAALARLPTPLKYGIGVGLLAIIGAGAVLLGTTQRDDKGIPQPGHVGVDARGRLVSAPAPMSEAEIVEATKRGSAPRAVLEFLYWAQSGSLPNLVQSYDPRIVASVGAVDIAEAWGQQRASLQGIQPRLVRSAPGRHRSSVVTLQILRKTADPQQASFTLRRRDGKPGWYVVFDSMLYGSIGSVVAAAEAGTSTSRTVARKAERAGSAAASRFRQAGDRVLPLAARTSK